MRIWKKKKIVSKKEKNLPEPQISTGTVLKVIKERPEFARWAAENLDHPISKAFGEAIVDAVMEEPAKFGLAILNRKKRK